MNRLNRLCATSIGGALLLAALAIQSGTSLADPEASASPSAIAPGSSASAAASAAPDAGPTFPRFDAEPFSDEKTPAPTLAEWKTAIQVALTDPLMPFEDCRAYRLREWVKLRCSKLPTSAIALLGGARDGVQLWVDPAQSEFQPPQGGEVIFPVRRGDRRVIEWSTFGESYDGPGFPVVSFLISESWAADEPGPRIIAP